MKKIKLAIISFSILGLFACGKSDGFKDEAERKFMNERGFKTKALLNDYLNATPENKVKISAHNLALKTTPERAMDCLTTAGVVTNYMNGLSSSTPETVQMGVIYVNTWDLVLQDMIKENKTKEADALSAIAEMAQTKVNKFQNGDDAYKLEKVAAFNKCKDESMPYFAVKVISSYK